MLQLCFVTATFLVDVTTSPITTFTPLPLRLPNVAHALYVFKHISIWYVPSLSTTIAPPLSVAVNTLLSYSVPVPSIFTLLPKGTFLGTAHVNWSG